MRLLTYHDPEAGGVRQVGVLIGDRIAGLQDLVDPETGPWLPTEDLVELLRFDPDLRQTRDLVGDGPIATGPELDRVRLAAPILRPGKIICVGLNYRDHLEEQHLPPIERPVLFSKFSNAVVADREPVIHHDATHALDLEVELAVVIGPRARRVTEDVALTHVAGYTLVNDVSARDLQGVKQALRDGERGDGQWLRAKGSDTFLPMGPVIVTPDELGDIGALRLRSWRVPATGPDAGRPVPMQDGSAADMVFDVASLIAFVSGVITLEPGDIISTGTPSGVGVFRDPPIFLEPGDVVRVEIDGIGGLTNPIVAPDGTAPPGSPAARLLAGEPVG